MIYFALSGLLLGVLTSILFLYNNTTGATEYSRQILFGTTDSSNLLLNLFVFGTVLCIVILTSVSLFVRDFSFPTKSPIKFTIETLLMATLTSAIIFIMSYLRGHNITLFTLQEFLFLFFKFGILHILLQFSGLYSTIFPST